MRSEQVAVGDEAEQTDTIRVLLVDDHQMFVESLARILERESGVEVVGTAATGAEGVRLAAVREPDVVVLDFQLPDGSGADFAGPIKEARPEAGILVLTGSADERTMVRALEAGASGFLTKDQAVEELVGAVRLTHAGEAYIAPSMLASLLPRVAGRDRRIGGDLSTREREVLACLGRGLTNAAIAEALFLSVHTVRNHVQSILTKLGAHSKLEAVVIASRSGLIEPH